MNAIPLALYVAALVAYMVHFARRQPEVGRAATTLLVAGALAMKARAPGSVAASERELRALRSVRAYDDVVVAPMHGFDSAVDYYRKVSCGPFLGAIAVVDLTPIVVSCFVLAMLSLMGGLLLLLLDTRLASRLILHRF